MAYNKTVVAGGALVGIIVVAGLLRLKFYFDPPEDNFTNQIDVLLNRQPQQMSTTLDEAPTALQKNPVVAVTPTVTTEPLYGDPQIAGLTTGIPLASLSEPTGTSFILLRDDGLFLTQYDIAWQLRDTEHLLMTGVGLVNGLPPVIYLQSTATGYRLFVSQSTAAGMVVNVVEVDDQFQATTTRVLPADPRVLAASADLLWSYTTDEKLQLFNIDQATLVAEPKLEVTPCALLLDQTAVIAVTAATNQFTFTKINALGSLEPTVAAGIQGVSTCLSSARGQQQLAVATTDQIILLDDNLSAVYPVISLPTPALFPRVGFTGDQLWVAYSSSATLGEYQLHVARYDLLVTAAQPDAADEYTN